MQTYLVAAVVKNLWNKDSVWQKQEKRWRVKPAKSLPVNLQISTETAQRYTPAYAGRLLKYYGVRVGQ